VASGLGLRRDDDAHDFILSPQQLRERIRETLQAFSRVSHLSRAAKKQEREEAEAGAQSQSDTEYAHAPRRVKQKQAGKLGPERVGTQPSAAHAASGPSRSDG